MRRAPIALAAALSGLSVTCNALLGNADHEAEADASTTSASGGDGRDTGSGGGDAATDDSRAPDGAASDATPPGDGAASDAAPSDDATPCMDACAAKATRCAASGVETCITASNGCLAWGAAVSCASGACAAGACTGACGPSGATQCSGNGVQTCSNGQWGAAAPCSHQTCISGACSGVCAPGEINPIPCGACSVDAQTCAADGTWKDGGCTGIGGCDAGADASNPAYCASLNPAPAFCDDFDEGTANNLWDVVDQNEGTLVINGGEFVSAPGSMLATINGGADPNMLDVAGFKSIPSSSSPATCTLAFDMRVDAAASSAGAWATLGAIEVNDDTAAWDLELWLSYVAPSSFAVGIMEIPPQVLHEAAVRIPMNTWSRFSFAIALPPASDGSAAASLTVNGATAVSTTVHVLGGSRPTKKPAAYVGANYATATSGGWVVRYDDVTFDLR
jgi:hypothetical protein